jgi:type VI secretion system secreted protein Hcp
MVLVVLPARAGTFYVTITGTKQRKFKGETTIPAHAAQLVGVGFDYGVAIPRDSATGLASGKRVHRPVVFTKQWGAASPQLFQAAVTNEVLKTVQFDFYRTDASGAEVVYYTVKLSNAGISSIRSYMSTSSTPARALNLEEVALTF